MNAFNFFILCGSLKIEKLTNYELISGLEFIDGWSIGYNNYVIKFK